MSVQFKKAFFFIFGVQLMNEIFSGVMLQVSQKKKNLCPISLIYIASKVI